MKIYEVAEQCGFDQDPQYFSNVFKKFYGYTPNEYRKQHAESSKFGFFTIKYSVFFIFYYDRNTITIKQSKPIRFMRKAVVYDDTL